MTSLTDRISKFVAEELDDLKDFMGRLSCSSPLQTDEYVNDGWKGPVIDAIPSPPSLHHRPPPLKDQPAVMRVHYGYIEPATLDHYRLMWRWDPYDEGYLLFKPWQSEHHREKLFEHTRQLRNKMQERSRRDAQLQSNHREMLGEQRRMSQGSDPQFTYPQQGSSPQQYRQRSLSQSSNQPYHSDYGYSTAPQPLDYQNNITHQQPPIYGTSPTSPGFVYPPTAPVPIRINHARNQPMQSSPPINPNGFANSLPADIWQGPPMPGGQWAPQNPLLIPSRPRATSYHAPQTQGRALQGPSSPGAQWSPRLAQASPSRPESTSMAESDGSGTPEMSERRRGSNNH